jgi:hypothetical protein
MEKSLRSYDISSYDLELGYNKQLSSIKKQKDKLLQNHEKKSLKSHKDFLKKEQKHNQAIRELEEKSVVKQQRIERAVSNKITRFEPRRKRKDAELQEYKEEQLKQLQINQETLSQEIQALNQEKAEKQKHIKDVYEENIQSYLEKLNVYQDNFKQNQSIFQNKVSQYREKVQNILQDLETSYQTLAQELEERQNKYLLEKEKWHNALKKRFTDVQRDLDQKTNQEQRQVNVLLNETAAYVNELRERQTGHYEVLLNQLEQMISFRKETFASREKLIKEDLSTNLAKLQARLDEFDNDSDKKSIQFIKKQMDLFKMRAETTLRYEQRLFDQELNLLEQELRELKHNKYDEEQNVDKLLLIMKSDLTEQKALAVKLNEMSLELKRHLDQFEMINKDYLLRHEALKADFIREYSAIFLSLKKALVKHTEVFIDQISKHYMEMDEIQLFIDTSEPLREVQVNKLRRDIEVSEVEERYQIRIAAKRNDFDQTALQMQEQLELKELEHRQFLNEFNQQIAEIRAKENYDKQLEEAKLRYKKANIMFNLRLDKIQLEKRLINSDFETQLELLDLTKQEKELEIRRNYTIYKNQLDYRIKDLELEAKYKMQVEQEKLEETIFMLKEKLNRAQYEQKMLEQSFEQQLQEEAIELEKQKQEIIDQYNKKRALIDTALKRELRIPTENKLKMEAMIDERLKKLDQNNASFVDFIQHLLSTLTSSTDASLEAVFQIDKLVKATKKYLEQAYEVKLNALSFMHELEIERIRSEMDEIIETSQSKKHQKRLERLHLDHKKMIVSAREQLKEQSDHFVMMIRQEIRLMHETIDLTENEIQKLADELYNKVFYQLNEHQNNLRQEITDIYLPLTEDAKKIIAHATTQAQIAQSKLQEEQDKRLLPINRELESITQKISAEKQSQLDALELEKASIREQIQTTKTIALEKIKQIEAEREGNIQSVKEEILKLQNRLDEEIKQMIAQIDNEITALKTPYEEKMRNINEQTEETKRIFAYEERIFEIAKNSAESRYQDALIQAKTVFQNNKKQYESKRLEIKRRYENKQKQIHDEFLEINRQHEQNIFTIRPRIEESMGDAKKEIEQQIQEKRKRFEELQKRNQSIQNNAQKTLRTTYHDIIDRLEVILQNYSEKYRLIDEEFEEKKENTNKQIRDDNSAFASSLLIANAMRHEALLKDLLSINASQDGREV